MNFPWFRIGFIQETDYKKPNRTKFSANTVIAHIKYSRTTRLWIDLHDIFPKPRFSLGSPPCFWRKSALKIVAGRVFQCWISNRKRSIEISKFRCIEVSNVFCPSSTGISVFFMQILDTYQTSRSCQFVLFNRCGIELDSRSIFTTINVFCVLHHTACHLETGSQEKKSIACRRKHCVPKNSVFYQTGDSGKMFP